MENDNIEEQLKSELERFKTATDYIEKVKNTAIKSQQLLNDLNEKYTNLDKSQSKSEDLINNSREQIANINKQINNFTKHNSTEDICLIKNDFENKMNKVISKINKENSKRINLLIKKMKVVSIVFLIIALAAIILGLII